MTKKILKKILVLVAVVMIAAIFMTSCTLIQENDERVYHETLYTITGADGIELTLTRAEVLSMYSTYASYYIQYYGYTAEEVMNLVIESRVKSKYLTTVAMVYLTDSGKVSADRIAALVGGGSHVNPVDVLTFAEKQAAILSVNKSIQSSLDTYVEESYQDDLDAAVDAITNTNVDSIEFTKDTLAYLKDEYYVNQGIDTDQVKFVVVYDDGTKSEEFIVPTSMYTTAFTSEEEATDSTIVISFDEATKNDKKETEYVEHTASFTYSVVSPRATKTVDEETDDDAIELTDGIKVNRYATLSAIDAAGATVKEIDLDATYAALKADSNADDYLVDAYRQLINALSSNYSTMETMYKSAYESAILSALQTELYKTASEPTNAEIVEQFKYLYESSKASYSANTDAAETFGTAIKSGIESTYYYPAIDNISGYFYVYQILFNFSDEQSTWLKANIDANDDDYTQKLYEFMKDKVVAKESNADYDADYDCPYHELGDTDEACTYIAENADTITAEWNKLSEEAKAVGYDAFAQAYADDHCPSVAYVSTDKDVMFTEVYKELSDKLAAATTPEEKFEIFENYMYRYNDDSGIMNSSAGYLIVPDGNSDPNSFYEAFTKLARDVYGYSAEVGNAFVKNDDGTVTLGYTFTPYGIHLIMVSMTPFGADANGTALSLSDDAAINAYLDREINVNGDTLRATLKDSLKTDNRTKAYSDFTSSNIPTKLINLKDDVLDTSIVTKNKKAVEQLYKDYIEQ